MRARRVATIALSGVLLAGGAGAAIATGAKDEHRKAEQAVLDDAAERLDVTPEQLRDALAAAQDAQLDRAVKDGRLTQEQADAIKRARRQSGHVLGPVAPPAFHRDLRPGHGGFGLRFGLMALMDDIAKALGTTPAKLVESLRAGKSLTAIAKANGKTLAEVRAAVKAAVKTRLDKAVEDGDLTRRQADRMLARLDDHLAAIGSGRPLRLHRHHHGGAPRLHPLPPPGAVRPGSIVPGEDEHVLVPPAGGTFF